jgi:DNA-binding response OmpR family regulator
MPDQVLIVDDDPRLVQVLRIRLETCGYLVHTAYCGEDGLSAAKKVQPQAIVLDVGMPGMDGLEMCRLVRAEPELNSTPIIIISAVTHENARWAALEAGANEFIGKPYQAAKLIAALGAAIENHRVAGGASSA